eukprot:CAMPEP_0197441514 /NCGR_PEP_ID=MMETSP1175-20131217/7772_1 /TAXON_ID=1003142 /ORGANISM="Triceratium dubium, Strain CCMP147" /LENGTH=89 /DNA_ID=CAMNT_0042971807 /DNA_START=24 /DNA_END=293 /DNA_ORIENTATION=-
MDAAARAEVNDVYERSGTGGCGGGGRRGNSQQPHPIGENEQQQLTVQSTHDEGREGERRNSGAGNGDEDAITRKRDRFKKSVKKVFCRE